MTQSSGKIEDIKTIISENKDGLFAVIEARVDGAEYIDWLPIKETDSPENVFARLAWRFFKLSCYGEGYRHSGNKLIPTIADIRKVHGIENFGRVEYDPRDFGVSCIIRDAKVAGMCKPGEG